MILWVGNAGGAQQSGSSIPCVVGVQLAAGLGDLSSFSGQPASLPAPFLLCSLRVSLGPTGIAQTSYETSQESQTSPPRARE